MDYAAGGISDPQQQQQQYQPYDPNQYQHQYESQGYDPSQQAYDPYAYAYHYYNYPQQDPSGGYYSQQQDPHHGSVADASAAGLNPAAASAVVALSQLSQFAGSMDAAGRAATVPMQFPPPEGYQQQHHIHPAFVQQEIDGQFYNG